MSIDLFREILELKSKMVSSLSNSTFNLLYNFYKLHRFINKNVIRHKESISYQYIYNFAVFINNISEGNRILKKMNKIGISFTSEWHNNYLNFFKIIYVFDYKDTVDMSYEYSIYPSISPGEIKFEYTEMYDNKDIHEDKIFINSLKLDPHKDNLYTKSAKHFQASNDIINEVIKIFFEYYINECKKQAIRHRPILKFIWRNVYE